MASWRAAAAALLLSASLIPTIFVSVSAQSAVSSDPAAPVFTQPVPNVFRRFAVDLAKMKEFYGDVLGLKPLPTLNLGGGGQMTRFHAGASEIKLQALGGREPGAGGRRTGLYRASRADVLLPGRSGAGGPIHATRLPGA